jgi:hypothetical protein
MNPNPNPDSPVVKYEMGYAADEFGKVLQGQFTGERTDFNCSEISRHRWRVTLTSDDFSVVIDVKQAPPRKIALFSLPVLNVHFEFERAEAYIREKFFHRFHQYFHKGGG